MWIKLLIITILFYILALIQNSFFVHFNILGAVPNFIFILFFILIFFSSREKIYSWENLFYSFVAGFFLDIFYFSYFGRAFAVLMLISLIVKKLFSFLKQRKDKYPVIYFVPLFLIFFIIYDVLTGIGWHMFWLFLIKIAYNLIFAILGFYVYKKLSND